MKRSAVLGMGFIMALFLFGCGQNQEEKQLKTFIRSHVEKIKPIEKEAALAYWNASITGKEEDYEKSGALELKLRQIYSNSDDFNTLKEYKESGQIKNPLLARQLDVLYNAYLANQIEPHLLKEIVDLSTKIQRDFSIFRGTIKGKKVSNNEIEAILKNENDSRKRKDAWIASKQVGKAVAKDIIQLVKLRNQAAQKLGFDNYHTLSLTTGEQNREELNHIFDELYGLTQAPFTQLKGELDDILAARYKIPVAELMPWHYHDPFFQETPLVYDLDLDTYYEDKDVKNLATVFFQGIGLPVESILEKSDLYEREGKNPHAFTTDIDKEGDVRVLCNLKNNERWMETLLHELGHGVYDKYQDLNVPYILRNPAHAFTTEAVAMFFGRLSRNPAWMQEMLGLSDAQRSKIEKVGAKYAQLKQLIFARWAMVMYNFEKELYANPDQDLNTLWWQLVEKYQLVKMPKKRNEPDWAAKIHFTIAPCYYHNYLLGELLASQFHHYLVTQVFKRESDQGVGYVKQPKAGDFFKTKVFAAGACYSWNDMIAKATGEPLSPKYFVQQFVK